jgi:hypothetical protein
MASSVITIFRWSIFRVSSLALILLWAFNPLGSQASFRGVYLRSNTGTSQGDITYYNANLSVQLYLTPFGSASSRSKPAIRALYSSTLYDYVSSIQYVDPNNDTAKGVVTMLGGESSAGIQAATDTWGNVRIPNLEYLSDYDPSKPQQWLETPWDQKVLNYSSLLGDRIVGVDRNFVGNSTFTISSSYQHYNVSMMLPSSCVRFSKVNFCDLVRTVVSTQHLQPNVPTQLVHASHQRKHFRGRPLACEEYGKELFGTCSAALNYTSNVSHVLRSIRTPEHDHHSRRSRTCFRCTGQ